VEFGNMEYQWRTGCGAAFSSAKEKTERDWVGTQERCREDERRAPTEATEAVADAVKPRKRALIRR
jgi:hypothetical protein